MDEYETPALAVRVLTGGLADMVVENAAADPGAVAIAVRSGGTWRDVSAGEFRDAVVGLAKGLLANGIGAGDRVGLMSRTRYEWTLFDYALWMIGACPVPVYPTSSPGQVEWILSDSEAVACVVETGDNAAAVESVRAELPKLREVWTVDAGAVAELTDAGADVADDDVERRRSAVAPDDPATIVYTSGTTGRPKGCVLTHRNFLDEVDNATELLYPVFRAHSKRAASTVVFVPLAHVLGRMLQVGCVRAGVRMGHEPSMSTDTLRDALRTFRPTFVVAVPYVFEKIHTTARQTAERMGRAASFDRAARVARQWGEALERDPEHARGAGIGLRLAHRLYDVLVYRRIRRQVGGRLRYAICGGSRLSRDLALFFAGAGIVIYEGYGLTETTGAATVNPPLAPRFGTAGKPLPGTAVRIAGDGVILLRGGQVFGSYWNDPGASAEALDDGWFRTGDTGELDDDGYLTITGREKDLLVTASGKNVAPGPLEDVIRAHPLVSQCLVIGDDRPFVAALVTLDADASPDDPAVTDEIGKAVAEANATVSRAESIREFRVVEGDFTEENGLLTPSLKVKRKAVLEAYADVVKEIYG
ncbi:MAG TPA: AMP-dependent synthetase/ligase [Streptosporangiales bacterium]